ncbi:MAG TPA: hypothetical protein VM406_11385 [Noviherbaspirillum sp.]|nr:hypothetical protein [Noviherbaspirillum sp.]
MTLAADALTMTLLVLLAVAFVAALAYALRLRGRARQGERESQAIAATLVEYFRRSGVTVATDCVRGADGRYTALIESEPMKRFRLSHIIEMTLRDHVRKATGLELDRIYWRFPVKEAVAAAAAPAAAAPAEAQAPAPDAASTDATMELSDDYINEGLEHYRHIPKPEVDELPWEAFEEVTGRGQAKEPPAG